MEFPLVSVLVLSMNHEKYIEQCINSIIGQSYKNLEIIYLDNVSSDNTFSIAEHLLNGSGIPHKMFRNDVSKGISTNLNFLFDQSSGKYVSPISGDDWFEKTNVEKKVSHFLGQDDVLALYSNGWTKNESTGEIFVNDSSKFRKGKIYKELLTQPDCIFYVGMMYKREIVELVGKWDESLLIEDLDLYLKIAQIGKIDFLDEPLTYYRRLEGAVSKNKSFMLKGFKQYYEKYRHVHWINMKHWLSERYRTLAANCIDNRDFKQAGNLLKEAFRYNPFGFQNLRTLFYLLRMNSTPPKNKPK